jgi:hypothetical protein
MLPLAYWITGLATAVAVVVCVLLHYEGLRLLSDRLPTPRHNHRRRIIALILSLLALHIIEVWIFGGVYYVLLYLGDFGELVGAPGASLIDCIYFSASVFTTVGFGDIYPIGAIRTMTGTEGIVGLTMIAWSASFTYVEMLKVWNKGD